MSLAGIRRYNRSVSFNQGVTGSRPVRPTTKFFSSPQEVLLSRFLDSRRQGISSRTIEFYKACLEPFVSNYSPTRDDINLFLSNLSCHNGKNAYYRAIRAFCNWLYRQGYIKQNRYSTALTVTSKCSILFHATSVVRMLYSTSKMNKFALTTKGNVRES